VIHGNGLTGTAMKDNNKRHRFAYVAAITIMVLLAGMAGCLETTGNGTEEILMDDDFYILLGINMAIFFAFLALFAFKSQKRGKQGDKMLDATLKPGSAASGPPPEIVPDNSRVCSICQTVNPRNQRFCSGCGFRL